MTKIDRAKIVRAALGSARLEGYKGSLKVSTAKRVKRSPSKAKPEATTKR